MQDVKDAFDERKTAKKIPGRKKRAREEKKYGKRMKTIWHDQMGQTFFFKKGAENSVERESGGEGRRKMCSLVMVGRRRKEEESRRESILLCPEKVTQIRSRQKEAKNERSQQKGKSRIPFLYFYFFGLQTTAGTSLV